MADDSDQPESGRRKDGKPFKPGNTRNDGSFKIGKNRPDVKHQFTAGDGRPRGRRTKGVKNLHTEWREELDSKITLSEGGKTKKVSKRRALVKSQIDRAIKKSDRAAETVLRYAEISEKREPGLQASDLEIIAAWLANLQGEGDTDDLDLDMLDQHLTLDDGSADGDSGEDINHG